MENVREDAVTHTDSVFSRYFYPVSFAIMGVLTPIMHNYYFRRPLYSGIQRHMLHGSIGFLLGYYIEHYLRKKWARRDAIIKHYVELHPEDFLVNKRKYNEIFEEWKPIR